MLAMLLLLPSYHVKKAGLKNTSQKEVTSRSEGRSTVFLSYLKMTRIKACLDTENSLA